MQNRVVEALSMDVTELRDFYAGPKGQMARRLVRRRIRAIWPHADGLDVLGLGYATPYLRSYRDGARRVIGFMPSCQGVVPWPLGEAPSTALVEDTALPLPDACIDRVLMVHEVENSEALRQMMREIWRVLAPEGRILVVVPNRRGLWARSESTPFGHGRPFSQGQMDRTLKDCMFQTEQVDWALFVPPFALGPLMTSAAAWENAGHRFWKHFGGVLLIEASKRVIATPRGKRFPVLKPVADLAGRGWRGASPVPVGTRTAGGCTARVARTGD